MSLRRGDFALVYFPHSDLRTVKLRPVLVVRAERQLEARIKEMLEARTTGRNAVIWKAKSGDIPDKEPSFLIAYMPLNFGTDAPSGCEAAAKGVFENCGSSPRKYRNGLGLAVPAAEQIEILRRSVRYLLAIEHVGKKSKQLNLTRAGPLPRSLSKSISPPTEISCSQHGTPSRTSPTWQAKSP